MSLNVLKSKNKKRREVKVRKSKNSFDDKVEGLSTIIATREVITKQTVQKRKRIRGVETLISKVNSLMLQ